MTCFTVHIYEFRPCKSDDWQPLMLSIHCGINLQQNQ